MAQNATQYKADGLTSLNYTLIHKEELSLCTWIKINLGILLKL